MRHKSRHDANGPVNRRELDELHGKIDPAQIEVETPGHIEQSMALGSRLFGEYLRLFQSRHRRIALPSR